MQADKGAPNFLIIQLSLNKHAENFLLDSGANISLLSNQYFMKIKHKLQYKRVACSIKISMFNSAISCIGCINLPFKIRKVFYKHSFFLIYVPSKSKFIHTLGIDFLKTHKVVVIAASI